MSILTNYYFNKNHIEIGQKPEKKDDLTTMLI